MTRDQDSLGDRKAATSAPPPPPDEELAARMLDELGLAAPVERAPAPMTRLCLTLAQSCNLRCPYCYGDGGEYGKRGLMTREVARAAIDMLFAGGADGDYRITLFGGEPLLNFEVLADAVEYAESNAAEAGRAVVFELNTNGMLITPDIADFLRAHEIEVIVSLDGERAVNDRARGRSYDAVLERLAPWLETRDPLLVAAATVTHLDPDLERHVRHLLGLGFSQVSARPVATTDLRFALTRDDWETMKAGASALASRFLDAAERGELFAWEGILRRVRALWRGEARGRRCGAGGEGLAVDIDGRLYPCHRFLGHQEHVWGDIERGFDQADQRSFLAAGWVDRRSACASCWARYLCGGRCQQIESLSVDGPEQAEGRCALARHEIALAVQVHTRLRERLGEHWLGRLLLARELARPSGRPQR